MLSLLWRASCVRCRTLARQATDCALRKASEDSRACRLRRAPRPFRGEFVASFASRNGSQIDAALASADAILEAEAPATAPRRILVVTDLRTRTALRPSDLRLRSGAIVHLGVTHAGQPGLDPDENDDDAPWSDVVERTGGVVWRATATVDPAANAVKAPNAPKAILSIFDSCFHFQLIA